MSPQPTRRSDEADLDRMPADRDRHDAAVQATSGINAVIGLWLMITPSMFDYQFQTLAISQGLVGFLLLASAGFRLGMPRSAPRLSLINVGFGLWLIIAPFLLVPGTGDQAHYWNSGISGIVVMVLGAWSVVSTRRGPARRAR